MGLAGRSMIAEALFSADAVKLYVVRVMNKCVMPRTIGILSLACQRLLPAVFY